MVNKTIILIFAAIAHAAPVTFHKDVLPILQKHCQSCHRPGEAAPMAFLTYESTRPWAKAMKQAVLKGSMPPWFAEPHVGQFVNDRRLPEGARKTLVEWADSGALSGDPADAPPPVRWEEGWGIGAPDTVFEMPVDYDVPATGEVPYTYFVIPTNFAQDQWIEAAEVRPSDRTVVHHVIAFIREPGSKWLSGIQPGRAFVPGGKRFSTGAGEDGMADDWMAGYAPGSIPSALAPGEARLVKAGSDIILQLHYTATGRASKDRTRVGVRFARGPVHQRVMVAAALNNQFVIPPGAPAHPVNASVTFARPVELLSMSPHMHVRGRSFAYRAVYPDGRAEMLLSVPRYDFNWQLRYELPEGKMLPAGTRIECEATFDNSPNNPHNPDPSAQVRWGDQSWQEMMAGFFDIAVPVGVTMSDIFPPPPAKSPARAAASEE